MSNVMNKKLLNKKVHVVSICNNIDVWGIVTSIDNYKVYGTWGDYVADLRNDYISMED